MMKLFSISVLLGLLFPLNLRSQSNQTDFPTGRIEGPFVWRSEIYPGTERNYWLYVPAQHDAAQPACVTVVQDGLGRAKGWGLIRAMDSLIERKEIPVMIGIFIDHGKVPAAETDQWSRFNRSFEYDALGDRYARFLIEEILPEVNRRYPLSNDPNDRCIAGASSGAICAFNAAWERPDAFRRVISTIGTYVGLRGGDEIPTLIRKTEPKPLRVFLEDGTGDLNIYCGDWFLANQDMLSALAWAGYEVNHTWGKEGHNSKGARAIMPEILAWIWADYPTPVEAHPEKQKGFNLLEPDGGWRMIKTGSVAVGNLAVAESGEVWMIDQAGKNLYRIDPNGELVLEHVFSGKVVGLAAGPNGTVYVGDVENQIIAALTQEGRIEPVLTQASAHYMVRSRHGLYFSDPEKRQIGFLAFSTGLLHLTQLEGRPAGLSVSAEQSFLNVSFQDDVFGHSFHLKTDGRLAYGQPYTHFHIPYGKAYPGAAGMAVDTANWMYTATDMGIQVSDQIGKVHFIFQDVGADNRDVKLGGPDFNQLYLVSDGKLFVRRIQSKGILPWKTPHKPRKPRL